MRTIRVMKKKIIETMAGGAVLACIMLMLGFSASSNMQKTTEKLFIRIESGSGQYFISSEKVRHIIVEGMDSLEGRIIDQKNLQEIHELVSNIPWVDHAAVYRTIDASVHVDIRLLEPMMRIVNNQNQSFYISYDGHLFPLSDKYTARVMLVSGDISLSPDETDHLQTAIAQDAHMGKRLQGLFDLAQYISGDKFWCALIDHIYLRRDGQFELTPKDGAHIIEFGEANDIEKKLIKLRHFYTGGITQVGWHYYNRINIAYANQVICTK